MPQYKRKLSKGIFYYFKYDYNGRTYHSKAIYQTKNDAKRAEAESLTKARDEEQGSPNMTVLELCNKRLDFIKTARSELHYKDNRFILRDFCSEFSRYKVKDISKKMIYEYLSKMSQGYKDKGIDNFSVNKHLRNLKSMFYYAIDVLDVIEKNPVKGIKPFAVTQKRKYIPADIDIKTLENFLNEDQRRLFIFVKETGCRISEAMRAKADDVGNKITLWTCKTRNGNLASHQAPITDAIKSLKLTTTGLLFPEWTVYPRFVEDACDALKIKKFGWHALRHRKASQWCMEGVPIVTIKEYLGHADISTTSIYLQSLPSYDLATKS